jgi:hypothetical protein
MLSFYSEEYVIGLNLRFVETKLRDESATVIMACEFLFPKNPEIAFRRAFSSPAACQKFRHDGNMVMCLRIK